MKKFGPKIITIYRRQVIQKIRTSTWQKSSSGFQEEKLARLRAELARSLDEARAAYLKSGKPLLSIEELDAEIAAIRG